MGLRCCGTNGWAGGIIEDARARDPTLPTLAEMMGISSDPFGIDDKSDSDGASVVQNTDEYTIEVPEEAGVTVHESIAATRQKLRREFHVSSHPIPVLTFCLQASDR